MSKPSNQFLNKRGYKYSSNKQQKKNMWAWYSQSDCVSSIFDKRIETLKIMYETSEA